MAFSKTLLDRYGVGGGRIREIYSWNGAGVTTSGNVAPDSTDSENLGTIDTIDLVSV